MRYLIMDFGGSLVKMSVMDSEGETYGVWEERAPLKGRKDFFDMIECAYQKAGRKEKINGVAVSMPGVIDGETGQIYRGGSYLDLAGVNLKREFSRRISVPLEVENDGKCGVLAEKWKGGLKDCDDGIVLILGTGVAGGIIKDGKIHRGKNLAAGEFSYMQLGNEISWKNSVLYKCGVAALLFRASKEKGIDLKKCDGYEVLSVVLDCEQTLSEWNDFPEYRNGLDGYKFFELLEKGDSQIRELYGEYIGNLAQLIFNLQTLYAPQKILIGGGISRQERIIPDIRGKYEKVNGLYHGIYDAPCAIERCKFGNEANQHGALYHFLCQQKEKLRVEER